MLSLTSFRKKNTMLLALPIENHPKTQKDTELTVHKCSEKSYKTQCRKTQIASIHEEKHERLIEKMS